MVRFGTALELVHRAARDERPVHDDADPVAECLRDLERMSGDENGIAVVAIFTEHALDEPGPVFSEGGALFWRELELVFGWGSLIGAERLKDEVSFIPVVPRFG